MKHLLSLVLMLLALATVADAARVGGGGGGGGGGGSVTSVDASGGIETLDGSPVVTTGTVRSIHAVNAQTGTTYTILTGDRAKLVTFANGSAIAVTLPQASGTFPAGWYVVLQNTGVGTVTVTPTTSTIDSASTYSLTTGQGVMIASNGTNYFTFRGSGGGSSSDTWQTVVDRSPPGSKAVYGLNSFANALRLQESNNAPNATGFSFYVHATNGPTFVCFIAGVENDCNYYRTLNSGKKFGIKNSAGTTIFEVDEGGSITWASINAETAGVSMVAPFKTNFKMVGCAGTTGTLLLDSSATLAPTATCTAGSTNTTLIMGYADFPDSAGQYQVQDTFALPNDWNGGQVTLNFFWRTTATAGDVIWYAATFCRADAEVEDAAWNTASSVTDTAKGTTLQLNTAQILTLDVTGCAASELMHIKFYRDNSGSDTLAATAQLRNVELVLRRGM